SGSPCTSVRTGFSLSGGLPSAVRPCGSEQTLQARQRQATAANKVRRRRDTALPPGEVSMRKEHTPERIPQESGCPGSHKTWSEKATGRAGGGCGNLGPPPPTAQDRDHLLSIPSMMALSLLVKPRRGSVACSIMAALLLPRRGCLGRL